MAGQVVQVNVNPAGGVPKHAVISAHLTLNGVEGDRQRDLQHHGGPDRAVCLYSMERIEDLRAEGHPIQPGSTGENVTLAGIDWPALRAGSRLRLGEAVCEITRPTAPCHNIAASFRDGRFARISQVVHPGWSRLYARVIQEGIVRTGDDAVVLEPSASQG